MKTKTKKKNKIICCDLDDCLLKADGSRIAIIKRSTGERLSTEEYASQDDTDDETKYSFHEFRDPDLVYNSIINGTPLVNNLQLMDKYVKKDYMVSILTARGLENVVKKAVGKFLLYRGRDGLLRSIEPFLSLKDSACVNDPKWNKAGKNAGEKKAFILKKLCNKYKKVVFIDDSELNIKEAKKLKLKNLKVIKV